jgi:hypothetical protein
MLTFFAQFLAKQMKEQRDYMFNQKLNISRPPIKEEVFQFESHKHGFFVFDFFSFIAHQKGLAILCTHRI